MMNHYPGGMASLSGAMPPGSASGDPSCSLAMPPCIPWNEEIIGGRARHEERFSRILIHLINEPVDSILHQILFFPIPVEVEATDRSGLYSVGRLIGRKRNLIPDSLFLIKENDRDVLRKVITPDGQLQREETGPGRR